MTLNTQILKEFITNSKALSDKPIGNSYSITVDSVELPIEFLDYVVGRTDDGICFKIQGDLVNVFANAFKFN